MENVKDATVNNVKAGSVLIHNSSFATLHIIKVERLPDVGLVFWFGNNPGDYLLSMNLRDWYIRVPNCRNGLHLQGGKKEGR